MLGRPGGFLTDHPLQPEEEGLCPISRDYFFELWYMTGIDDGT